MSHAATIPPTLSVENLSLGQQTPPDEEKGPYEDVKQSLSTSSSDEDLLEK
jgi:hypothetical protein